MAKNDILSVVFPAMNIAGEAKTKGLVEKIADFMGVKVEFETVIVMKVNYPRSRQDMGIILKRLTGNKIGLTDHNLNQSKKSSQAEQADE
jgi:hypothetical protein